MKHELNEAVKHWPYLSGLLTVPRTEEEYGALIESLDALLDDGGADENHPLAGLVDVMGTLIEQYDMEHFGPIEPASGVEMLKHFMQDRGLKQADLPEIGSQGVVSEILSGKRELNLRQIQALATRFGVPAGLFV